MGWPKSVYSDNGTHFTGSAIRKMWTDHGVLLFTAPVSHPQSVGLSERYVQMTMGRIRLKSIAMGLSRNWGLLLKDAVIDINTRCVRIHGFTPSEILLGFNLVTSRNPVVSGELDQQAESGNWTSGPDGSVPDEDTIHEHLDRRGERGQLATQKLARNQDQIRAKQSLGYKRPKAGDLVLVRDIQLAKEKGKKLEPRWSTPWLLERISESGVSGHIRQLHDPPGRTKRFHIDDLMPYLSRSDEFFGANAVLPIV